MIALSFKWKLSTMCWPLWLIVGRGRHRLLLPDVEVKDESEMAPFPPPNMPPVVEVLEWKFPPLATDLVNRPGPWVALAPDALLHDAAVEGGNLSLEWVL